MIDAFLESSAIPCKLLLKVDDEREPVLLLVAVEDLLPVNQRFPLERLGCNRGRVDLLRESRSHRESLAALARCSRYFG